MHADPLFREESEHTTLARAGDLHDAHPARILLVQLGQQVIEVSAFTIQGCW